MQNVIKELEKVVKAMTRKVIHLKEQIVKIKADSKATTNNDVKKQFADSLDFKSSTPVSAKEKQSGDIETKPIKSKKDKFKCDNCEYLCQKDSTLRKPSNTRHVDQECKENEIHSTRLQDLEKVGLDKIYEKEQLSLTQKI